MSGPLCRSCRATTGQVVLDLGAQPPCDLFPPRDSAPPDPVYPLQMWLCSACSLAQLVEDATGAEEPKATEPAALVAQAADAVGRVAEAGWLPAGSRVAEFGSPHGGSWLDLLAERGLVPVGDEETADVVLDCFGLMHAADQATAVQRRAERVDDGGVLLVQFHSLATIVERGQWNSLRHGHFAYYSTTALAGMLAGAGLHLRQAWQFELYGGTVLLAATREPEAVPDRSVRSLLEAEAAAGVTDPRTVGELQHAAVSAADGLRAWLASARDNDQRVLGYGAASRAVALLCRAGVDVDLLPAVADASPAKQGLRMPGTHIPVISPDELLAAAPDAVVLFLPDLLDEVRARLPGIEAAGGRWVDVEDLVAGTERAERNGRR